MTSARKIILGTASFGAPYGIANGKQLEMNEVQSILRGAQAAGFGGYDTARDYIGSESRIGLSATGSLNAYTKFSHGTDFCDRRELARQAEDSSRVLNVKSICGMSPHSFGDFKLAGEDAVRNFNALKQEGWIQSWGLSLYDPREFFKSIEIGVPDFIQIPLNILDRRFVDSGAISIAKEMGIAIQVRSIYLQGALLQHPDALPKFLEALTPQIRQIRDLAGQCGLSVESMLLIHALREQDVDEVVVGVNSYGHVLEIQETLNFDGWVDFSQLSSSELASEELIDPRKWLP